jgi:5-methylthioadenosine/S-adenosylhomocysteine deaminase
MTTGRRIFGVLTVLLLALPLSVWAGTSITLGSAPQTYVLKGTFVTPGKQLEGELVIERDTITCLAVDCEDPPSATLLSITDAYIFPGFVDAHNHVAYNVLPKWTPPKLYKNRGQWQASSSYKSFKAPYAVLKDQKQLYCEMVKYGELKALISGITSIQGTAPDRKCFRTLIRNVENQSELNLPAAYIRTSILDINSFKDTIDWNQTRSFVVHLSEGIDETSRKEFNILKQKGLLTGQTAIIHGTAFGAPEFRDMADVGAKLVWSPKSNLALYGQTTDIKQALEHGVSVSLGVDWNPTGSDNVFEELRVAAQLNEEEFEGAITEQQWLAMITTNPAKALALERQVGTLAVGMKADIAVLRSNTDDPHHSLLKSHLQDVEMVFVGGELLYGRATTVQRLKPDQCEALRVYGAMKRICVSDTRNPVEKSSQTLATLKGLLQAAYPQLAPLTP